MKLPLLLARIGRNIPVNKRDHLKDVGIVKSIILKRALMK
jgi:hypothetical protein